MELEELIWLYLTASEEVRHQIVEILENCETPPSSLEIDSHIE